MLLELQGLLEQSPQRLKVPLKYLEREHQIVSDKTVLLSFLERLFEGSLEEFGSDWENRHNYQVSRLNRNLRRDS